MSFGSILKQARESQGLSLQELALKTKIRGDYLQALEEGKLSLLPERTFARSYLQRYARELGLEAAPLMAEFDRAFPAQAEIAQSMANPTLRGQGGQSKGAGALAVPAAQTRRGLSPALLAALTTGLLLLGAGGYYAAQVLRPPAQVVTPTPPPTVTPAPARPPAATTVRLSIRSTPPGARVFLDNRNLGLTPVRSFPVDARQDAVLRVEYGGRQTLTTKVNLQQGRNLAVTLAPTGQGRSTLTDLAVRASQAGIPATTPAGVPGQPTAPKATTPPAVPTPAGAVRVRFTAASWTRVTDRAGRVLFEGIPAAGTVKAFPAGVTIKAGNAAAVQVSVNGGTALAMGGAGRVVTRSF